MEIEEFKNQIVQHLGVLDKDNKIGWHIHPLHNTSVHQQIEEKTVQEIVSIFDQTIRSLLGE